MVPQSAFSPKPYLIDITLQREKVASWKEYPFSLPVVQTLDTLQFHPDVTFFIGENGMGKSTLLEAIAILLGFNAEGGSKNVQFSTRDTQSDLSGYLRSGKSFKAARDGYFLRAESFYNVASYLDDVEVTGSYGGKSLHAQSHGESFLSLLQYRFNGNGLYLLDEPEAALSPTRQLAVLALMHKLVNANSQFIIATHSPILLAYPNARTLRFSETGIDEVSYEETDNYRVSKDFFEHREQMLRVLLEEENEPDGL